MTILIIAQNGLKTAATLFSSKALKIEKQIKQATDKKEIAGLKKSLNKLKKLASILSVADQGITSYLIESQDDE